MSEPTITVGAAEANRRFSRLLRAVKEGRRVTITSHGEPVAQLVPPEPRSAEQARIAKAQAELMAHLLSAKPVVIGPWTRDELHDREER